MNEIWVLAETKDGKVSPVSYELLAWARGLGAEEEIQVTAVLPGPASNAAELCLRGADLVLHGADPGLGGHSPRRLARFLASLLVTKRPAVLLAAATSTGRSALPYLAALEGLGLTADCTGLVLEAETGALLQTRPAAGGNIMATIRTLRGRPQLATVRPHGKLPLEEDAERPVKIEFRPPPPKDPRDGIDLVEERPFPRSRGIADARVVVAGGRGFRKKENFRLLDPLARKLGGKIGASREAVDRGWAEYPRQVGLSGRTISPELYVAIGISGAIQHLAGMQTAGTIVSINTDCEAPITAVSDLAIQADLFQFLPLLEERLSRYTPGEGDPCDEGRTP